MQCWWYSCNVVTPAVVTPVDLTTAVVPSVSGDSTVRSTSRRSKPRSARRVKKKVVKTTTLNVSANLNHLPGDTSSLATIQWQQFLSFRLHFLAWMVRFHVLQLVYEQNYKCEKSTVPSLKSTVSILDCRLLLKICCLMRAGISQFVPFVAEVAFIM